MSCAFPTLTRVAAVCRLDAGAGSALGDPGSAEVCDGMLDEI